MEVVRALVRRKAKGLRLLGVPQLGMCADRLIGAGCVAEIETSAVTLGEAGLAPRFTEAAEKGVPFMPLRGVLGSDLLKLRPDWKVSQNPFNGSEDPILYIPAVSPDVALFHARWADEAGNVWIGRRRELATIAHASKRCFVTYEEKRPGDMLEDEVLAPGVLSATYVTATAQARRGAWPLGVPEAYDIDDAHLARYAKLAKTREGFGRYLDEFVLRPVAA